ncbi:MAG: alanine racemase [Hungatella sp.]|jgi:alanine racemase|nr:alanine racemase [Hungatella sp.]
MEEEEVWEQRPYTRVYATVDLDAVEDNVKAMKAGLSENTSVMAVVKADGYGHGAVPVAKAVEPYVAMYGTATLEEALDLQRHGITKPVLVLGVTHKRQYEQLVRQQIRPAVFSREQAKGLSETAVRLGTAVYVHLALDTGMSRIGMSPTEESADLVIAMSQMPGICLEGLFTHFARADERDKGPTFRQMDQYLGFVKMLEDRGIPIPVRHISNSAAIVDMREADFDMARAGISLYGMYASDQVERENVALRPAMELKSCIACMRDIGPGTPVSYGGAFVADKPMRVATIPVGYGDGYPRNLSGKGRVLIRGKSAPILGRICMDQMMVDVTGILNAREDDPVTLIGRDGSQEITVEELARLGGGFHYEIVCNLGKRIPRIYTRGGKAVGKKDHFSDWYEDFCHKPGTGGEKKEYNDHSRHE